MIKFNDRFSCERDKYQWILTETYSGVDKKNKPKKHSRATYHGSLKQVCAYVVDKTAGGCNAAEEIKTVLGNAINELTDLAINIAEE